jgi:hypothetical protein
LADRNQEKKDAALTWVELASAIGLDGLSPAEENRAAEKVDSEKRDAEAKSKIGDVEDDELASKLIGRRHQVSEAARDDAAREAVKQAAEEAASAKPSTPATSPAKPPGPPKPPPAPGKPPPPTKQPASDTAGLLGSINAGGFKLKKTTENPEKKDEVSTSVIFFACTLYNRTPCCKTGRH